MQREFINETKHPIVVNRIDVLQFYLLNQDGEGLDFTLGGMYSTAEGWNLVVDVVSE